MNEKHKELYETPLAMTIEVNIDAGIMLTSDYNYGNLDEPDNVMSLINGQEFTF